ncbi:hypothetical protein K8W47_004385 [Escherichia coli]|nr:hypothetical protein [Escherichia coli]
MKYLAVLLAILSAGSAWGAELIRYVPTRVHVDFIYHGPTGSIPRQTKTFETTEPVSAEFYFEDKDRSDPAGVEVHSAKQSITNGPNGTFDVRGLTGQTVHLNKNYKVIASMVYSKGDGGYMPVNSGEKEHAYLPTSGSSDVQKVRVDCGVPENIIGNNKATGLNFGTTISFKQTGVGLVNTPITTAVCRWDLRAIYNLSLSLEKTVMEIVDQVGSNTTHENKLHVTGNGGAVRITIDNPEQADISASFSEINPSVLTTTANPTMDGTTVPFYVVVQNTRAGSRTYNVNFTAAYI